MIESPHYWFEKERDVKRVEPWKFAISVNETSRQNPRHFDVVVHFHERPPVAIIL